MWPNRISSLTRGLPQMRWNIAADHTAPRWSLLTRLNFYGNYWDREDARAWAGDTLGDADLSSRYDEYSANGLLDLEVGVPIRDGFSIAVGGQNVLNTYPEINTLAASGTGNRYGQFSPFGFNGANYYVRLNYAW